MRLVVTTPLSVAVDEDDVVVVSGEDASGRFGIQPRHADFLTSLSVGVVSWRSRDGSRHHCAVRGGVLTVSGGAVVAIATREAVPGDDLATLDRTILARFHADAEADRAGRVDATRLQLDAIRRIVRHLRPGAGGEAGWTS